MTWLLSGPSSNTPGWVARFVIRLWHYKNPRCLKQRGFFLALPRHRKKIPPTWQSGVSCHRVNSFIFQRANPHILSPYPLHSLFRTLSLFSPIIIIALWNLTGRDFPRHFPLIFTSFPRPFPGYSHTLPTHFHWFSLALPWPFFLFHSSHCSHSFLVS